MTNAVTNAFAGVPTTTAREIARGFSWPECPRWHDGTFWFSDMYTGTLKTIDSAGQVAVVVDANARSASSQVPIVLGGFGWLPDGRLIVTSMHEKLVLVHDGSAPDALTEYADVAAHAPGPINDMVVDSTGRAYVTQLGFDLYHGADPAPSPIVVVDPDGAVSVADKVGPLMGANGIALSADEKSAYTAEAFLDKILVMNRSEDGTLSDHKVFAVTPSLPDGIALDDDGGVWAAMPGSGYVARFGPDGAMTDAVFVPLESGTGSACMLGGPDRKTLYITVGVEVFDFEKSAREARASIWIADVSHSGGNSRP
ncbi:lactone hydrolase [Rhodococcus sp. 05-340-1]|uniref:SMP-30/gluconolactonase/LRE family protein n=1 Tax=Nocardiaceae TaxID=85025 RepID=UPI00050CE9E5|nr:MULTISPECIES: SMP-30/gluconolactonase/LRE family protein [Rhodococcus]OZC87713.1 lactone hydrolase [Rhodococcus sp. 06-412-2C]OZC96364.1 lactone hydrolase [Rhodococcus sp. 06-412-2B]OZD65348.1 lactone hydrolase [Rhodococcus sp. 05-340-2]OZD74606.1 lactone hydrolase [Rhodococcus sp. 05-340-1]OZD86621.1 lactone hydrolase [Rhodococcus sp. 05-339-2]